MRAGIHTAACGGPCIGAGGCALKKPAAHEGLMQEHASGRNSGLWDRVHTGAGFLSGTVGHGGSMLKQVYPQGLQPMGRTHAGAGEKCKEEGVAETH